MLPLSITFTFHAIVKNSLNGFGSLFEPVFDAIEFQYKRVLKERSEGKNLI